MPIEKPRKDERVSAAYKGSNKPISKSNIKRKDDTNTKQRQTAVGSHGAIPKNKDKKIDPLSTSEVTKYSGKTKSHVVSEAAKKTVKLTTSKSQKPENVKASSVKSTKPSPTRNVKVAESRAEITSKVQKQSSSVANKTDVGGKIKLDHRVKTKDLKQTSIDVSDSNTVDEKPKISRQDTFELPTVTENVDQDDDDSVSYDQDFEDYESDFEVDEDEGISENMSNDGVNLGESVDHELDYNDVPREIGEVASRSETSDVDFKISPRFSENVVAIKEEYVPQIAEIKPERPKTASFHNFINFAESQRAQRHKQVSDKIRNRGIKLLQLLTLDTMNFNIFEMKPVKYSIFMLAFGGLNKVQVMCQTEVDGSEAETQTDEITVLEKWTQHPPDCTSASGGQSLDNDSRKIKQLESKRLVKVLRIASKTVEILLDEELMKYSCGKDSQGLQSPLEVCNSVLRLTPPEFMKGSIVTSIHYGDNNPFVILSAHQSLPEPMDGHGAVCVWDLLQPIKPKRVLLCATHPTRCCFASRKLAAVVAGAIDGSLMIWDLQDTATEYNITCSDVPLHSPTYCTAGVNGHQSSIVDVQHLTTKYNNNPEAKDDGPAQIASLEEFAVFMVWVIVEARGSEDVRLAPDGRLMMVPSARVELNSLINPSANAQVFGFEAHPREPNNFFVTTDLGAVLNFKLNGGKVKQYKHSPDVSVEVSTISICAFDLRRTCFLAGCNDGTVRLHAVDSEKPIISWAKAANGAPIKTVMWSSSGPNIFFILDSFGQLHVWDLTYSDVHPCFSSDSKIARYECAVIGSDPRGFRKEKRTFQPYLAFGTSEGIIEVHYLKENFSRYGKEEVDLFNFYLDIL